MISVRRYCRVSRYLMLKDFLNLAKVTTDVASWSSCWLKSWGGGSIFRTKCAAIIVGWWKEKGVLADSVVTWVGKNYQVISAKNCIVSKLYFSLLQNIAPCQGIWIRQDWVCKASEVREVVAQKEMKASLELKEFMPKTAQLDVILLHFCSYRCRSKDSREWNS